MASIRVTSSKLALANAATTSSSYLYGMPNIYPLISANTSSMTIISNGATVPTNGIHMYKGTMPTQNQLDAMSTVSYTTLASLPRYSDLLIAFPCTSTPIISTKYILVTSNQALALQTGGATWFMIFASSAALNGSFAIAGTVSMYGMGGDLEMENVSYSQGSAYTIAQVSMGIPTIYRV